MCYPSNLWVVYMRENPIQCLVPRCQQNSDVCEILSVHIVVFLLL